MTSKRPEDVFVSLLRSTYCNARHGAPTRISTPLAPRRLSSLVARSTTVNPSISQQLARTRIEKLTRAHARTFATTQTQTGKKPREIAVLGGGITGLTTTHYLARHAPDANITLYEGSDRLGGWVDGKLARTGDGKYDGVLLQRGPRMLRPGWRSTKYDDLVFYDVVANLGLETKLLPALSPYDDRYIYYPDHLVKLPMVNLSAQRIRIAQSIIEIIKNLFTEPLFGGAIKSLINMMRVNSRVKKTLFEQRTGKMTSDESVAEYFGRRCGDDRPVKNIISAIYHGVYGGDIYKLSMKQTFLDSLWRASSLPTGKGIDWMETKDMVLAYDMEGSPNYPKINEMAQRVIGWSTMRFQDGLLSLANGLTTDLKQQKNVRIKTGSRVTSLSHEGDKVLVTTADKPDQAKQYDQVISTLFSKHLAELVEPKGLLPSLANTHAVTIMVVNLWFPNPHLLDGNHGFGYLVPQSTPGNDECVLGVLFDSDLESRDERPGTKLTVMLGGHYWDGWERYPSEEMAKEMALQAVQRHLRISPDENVIASARLCRECLPQHYVGHRERMKSAHYELLAAFKGRLSVAGPSYTAVGVIPAMRAGFDVAMRVAHGRGPLWYRKPEDLELVRPDARDIFVDHVGETGLEVFTEPEMDTIAGIETATLPFKNSYIPIDKGRHRIYVLYDQPGAGKGIMPTGVRGRGGQDGKGKK
ncbi:Protoporphyrinogen oxidase [Hypoxylon sp. EC38]|nr:Protoporphyrinogen oxidase [Hypoxylon sp. EC38]